MGIAANAPPENSSRPRTKGIDQFDGSRKMPAAKPEDPSSILSWDPRGRRKMVLGPPCMCHDIRQRITHQWFTFGLSFSVSELPREFVLVHMPRWNLSFVTVIKLYLDNCLFLDRGVHNLQNW